MIRDFKKTKEQLREIADVINSFKSEAVQLRLLELVFSMQEKEEDAVVATPAPIVEGFSSVIEKAKTPRKKRVTKEKVVVEKKKEETRGRKPNKAAIIETAKTEISEEVIPETSKKKKPGRRKAAKPAEKKKNIYDRPGPSVILRTLVADKYFDENRTIGDVVKHCLATYQFKYASTDLSGTLARLVKDTILKRVKNAETNQFEYSLA